MKDPKTFEKQFVHSFYEDKSKEFDVTRQRHWPKTLEFLQKYNKPNFIVLDNGCGNGRCLLDKNIIGLDYSKGLLKQAKNKTSNSLIRGDVLNLPFANNSFDLILSIAVIHHLSTEERRLKALKEIKRILKINGKCLVYVWDKSTSYKNKFSQIEGKDYFVTWNKDNEVKRYYYLFDLKEFKEFCESLNFTILEIGKEQESLFAILEKKF